MSKGFKAVEFDVMLTKDNIPMLMHDHILSRTTGNNYQNSWFSDLDYQTLSEVDVGSWFDKRLSDVRIPLFEDVIKFCIQNNIWMNIEIKPVPGYGIYHLIKT